MSLIMGATFVMSHPGVDFSPSGRKPVPTAPPPNPRAALTEWIALADAIHYAGGRILLAEPMKPQAATPDGPPPRASALHYTADWGALVRRNDRPLFLLPRAIPSRAAEREVVSAFFGAAGVDVQALPCATAGRGDLIQVNPGRHLFIAGGTTEAGAGAIVAKELGQTVRWAEASVAMPFTFGDEVVAMFHNKANDGVMLCHEAGLKGKTIPDLRATFSPVDVIPVDADDADAGACTSLCVNGTVIHPSGLSTALRSHLVRRGFQLVELDLPQLWGVGGGGAHALVNELHGFVVGQGAPDYPSHRERILALVDTYPEK